MLAVMIPFLKLCMALELKGSSMTTGKKTRHFAISLMQTHLNQTMLIVNSDMGNRQGQDVQSCSAICLYRRLTLQRQWMQHRRDYRRNAEVRNSFGKFRLINGQQNIETIDLIMFFTIVVQKNDRLI